MKIIFLRLKTTPHFLQSILHIHFIYISLSLSLFHKLTLFPPTISILVFSKPLFVTLVLVKLAALRALRLKKIKRRGSWRLKHRIVDLEMSIINQSGGGHHLLHTNSNPNISKGFLSQPQRLPLSVPTDHHDPPASLSLKKTKMINASALAPHQVEMNGEIMRIENGVEDDPPVAMSFLPPFFVADHGGFSNLCSNTSTVLRVAIISAVELERKQLDLIAKKMRRLTGFRNLKMETKIDPSLIAGFVISYDGDESNVIDLSVKGQLSTLAERVESSEKRSWCNSQIHKVS